jgi:peptidoglycan/LPS O-acetylase OafA/YrhL
MISGALLLAKENESIKLVWRKRILKIAFILLVFSPLIYMERVFVDKFPPNLQSYFQRLYTGDIATPYWYLYAFIAYLISLPILRKLAKNLGEKEFFYIIGLSVIFTGLIPIFEYICNGFKYRLNGNLSQWILNTVVMYPVLGYLIEHKLNMQRIKKYVPLIWFINILCIFISCCMTYLRMIDTGECSESTSQFFHNSFVSINAVAVFLSAKIYFENGNLKENHLVKAIYKIAGASFGIYLLHVFIIYAPQLKALIFENRFDINYMLNAFIGV